MIQGTMSNAGKSLLAAGLCRALSQDGLRVAPFKSQNMALNSGVTADGLEMGRAQIMQAEACGIAPDVRMNPILLKPESDHRSQLIVAGKAQGAFAARDYFARKKALMPQILEAFDSLAEENDVIVIEGAGSPVEINLAENDIVNMGLARAVSSPVLLAGDIDPGGVFAQLYGTVALLAPEDRALLRGLVVNKFRGDVEILRPGLAPLEKMCGVPVVGVVPYLKLDLDDEDSLAPRLSAREARGVIDVAVVRLPHLSNFTDFDPLSRVPGVGVRYVSSTTDLGRPDLVVLPGSKTTLDDARWLAASGIGACVRALSGAGTPVLGICGGYQLLGDELSDPHGREGVGTARGLGLIPASTVFKEEKHLAQSELRITGAQGAFSVWNGMTARGYEIHDGETTVSCAPAGTIGGKPEGAACGNVFGTYLHGLFDTGELTEKLTAFLCKRKGIDPAGAELIPMEQYRQQQFDLLFHLLDGRLQFGDLAASHFAHLLVLVVGQDVFGFGQVGDGRAVAFRGFDDRFQLPVFLVELDELLDVGDHFGIGEFLADLFVFELQTVQSGEYGIVCHII